MGNKRLKIQELLFISNLFSRLKKPNLMKQIKTYFFTVILAAITFTGCKKDDAAATTTYPSGQGEITGTGASSFSVNGTNALFNKQTVSGVTTITIIGSLGTPKQFIISFNNITAAGTYSLVPNAIANTTLIVTYVAGSAGTDNYFSSASAATAGSITVTSVSATSIEGTYTAKVTNTASAALAISGTFKGNF